MSDGVKALDALPEAGVAELLRACCGATRWVRGMLARRPWRSAGSLHALADEVWDEMQPNDWMEAFSHHPRIGEHAGAGRQDARGAAWSAGEQGNAHEADEEVREALARMNRAFESRFGHTYIVCASGRSAEELLAIARRRLRNEPGDELCIAAEEQRRIMHLRLDKLLGERA